MKIKLATLTDLHSIVKTDTFARQNSSRIEEIKAWLSSQAVYLLEVNAQIVGYGVIHNHFFGQLFIELVMIAKEHRGLGYGKRLIASFQENIATQKLFTSTNQSNLKMQSLLEKLGFVKSGYIQNLDDNDPEIIFFFKNKK